jgi:hypothetical protein
MIFDSPIYFFSDAENSKDAVKKGAGAAALSSHAVTALAEIAKL